MTDSHSDDLDPPQMAARVTVKYTKAWWPPTAVVAWIIARDLSEVDALCRPLPALDKHASHFRLSRRYGGTIRTASRELFDKLAAGVVTAYGDPGTGRLECIPSVEFSRPPGPPKDGTDQFGGYRDVVIARDEVLRLWPDPRWEALRSTTEPLTLAAGVALLVRGRPAPKDAWARLRRRAGGRFPPAAEQRIEAAGQAIVGMIRNGIVEAFGFRCRGDGGIGGFNPSADEKERLNDDRAFLAHQLWIAPWADAIWTEPDLGDGHFNPTDRSYRYVCLDRTQFLDAIRNHDTKAEAYSTVNQRIRTSGVTPERLFGRAAVVRRPEGSIARGPEGEVSSESLNTADCAEPPARNHGRERHKATISPAPKRGRAHQYDWASFDGSADDLFRKNPAATLGDATRAMTEWAGREWGGPDGPGEPAVSLIRERLAYHPGAPWLAALTDRQRDVIRELRKEATRNKRGYFSTKEFGGLCVRSGVVDPTTPKSSQRRLKSDLKMQLANKGLITVVDGVIRLASPRRLANT